MTEYERRISDCISDVCSSDLDFPYDPRLTAPLAVSAGLANDLMFMQVLPIGAALVMAITMVGGMALATRAILRTRQLDARYHQTFAALLATNAALTFLLVPFFAQIAPMLRELARDRKSTRLNSTH